MATFGRLLVCVCVCARARGTHCGSGVCAHAHTTQPVLGAVAFARARRAGRGHCGVPHVVGVLAARLRLELHLRHTPWRGDVANEAH